MRIGIDARLNAYRTGGISQYTRQLLTALAPIIAQDELVVLQHFQHLRPLVVAPNVRREPLFTPPHHRFEPYMFPLELRRLRLDLLHCPDFIAPRYRPCPAVITIHDLAFLRYPDILDASARRYYYQVYDAVRHANAVIAVSETTRCDIVELLEIPSERVDVVYEAAAPIFAPQPVASGTVRMIHNMALQAGTFMLFVSTIEPRKNLPMLFQALRICCDRRPDVPYRLVVAGARGWHDHAIIATVQTLRLTDRVLFLGQVDMIDLHWLYNACLFYVNPSRYEGFGLTVLEALACGAPTVIADGSSLPEIAGDAAVRLPPDDAEAWADGLERLWHDPHLRHTLSSAGPARAALFSWERAALETLAIYRRVLAAQRNSRQ